MLLQDYLVPLLLKLGVMASIASILARSSTFKAMLMLENRTLNQRMTLSALLSIVFGGTVAMRILAPTYRVADLGLEGSLIAGILGGYVTGLVCGVLISLPAVFAGQSLTMPLLAGIGVLGGLLRDLAPSPDDIWRFSFFDLSIYRFFKENKNYRRASLNWRASTSCRCGASPSAISARVGARAPGAALFLSTGVWCKRRNSSVTTLSCTSWRICSK